MHLPVPLRPQADWLLLGKRRLGGVSAAQLAARMALPSGTASPGPAGPFWRGRSAQVLLVACTVAASLVAFDLLLAITRGSLIYPQPDRAVLVTVRNRRTGAARLPVTPADLVDWRRMTRSFSALGGVAAALPFEPPDLVRGQPVIGVAVTQGALKALGVRPVLGSGFRRSDFRGTEPTAAVISFALWQAAFGGRRDALGRRFRYSDTAQGGVPTALRLVGVMPPGFHFPYPAEASWVGAEPSVWTAIDTRFDSADRIMNDYLVVGRLRPGVTVAQARADLRAAARRLGRKYPRADAAWEPQVTTLRRAAYRQYRGTSEIAFGAALLLFLIGAVNLAGLGLARTQQASWELSLRLALGAPRGLLRAEVFAGGAGLALFGWLAGVFAAAAALAPLSAAAGNSASLPPLRAADLLRPAPAAAAAGMLVLLVAALGLLPAFALTSDPAAVLRRGAWLDHAPPHGLRGALLAAQLGLAFALVGAMVLLAASLRHTAEAPSGFQAAGLHILPLYADAQKYPLQPSMIPMFRRVLTAARQVPGVSAVGFGMWPPWGRWPEGVWPAGPAPQTWPALASQHWVSPGYFHALGVPILSGRGFRSGDAPNGPLLAVISKSLALRLWPGRSPLGAKIQTVFGRGRTFTVVGVAGNVRAPGRGGPPPRIVYVDDLQLGGVSQPLFVRSAGWWPQINADLRGQVYRVDPTIFVDRTRSMAALRSRALSLPKLRATAAALAALLAVLIAMAGTASFAGLAAAARRRESAIRAALGAGPGRLGRQFGVAVLAWCAAGLALGVLILAALGTVLRHLLFGLGPLNPAALLAAALLLCLSALAAAFPVLWRASRQPPAEALRNQ